MESQDNDHVASSPVSAKRRRRVPIKEEPSDYETIVESSVAGLKIDEGIKQEDTDDNTMKAKRATRRPMKHDVEMPIKTEAHRSDEPKKKRKGAAKRKAAIKDDSDLEHQRKPVGDITHSQSEALSATKQEDRAEDAFSSQPLTIIKSDPQTQDHIEESQVRVHTNGVKSEPEKLDSDEGDSKHEANSESRLTKRKKAKKDIQDAYSTPKIVRRSTRNK